MDDKLLDVIERNAKSSEALIQVSNAISKNLDGLTLNMSKLNDAFPLHSQEQNDIKNNIYLIKKELLKYIKWLIAVVFVLLGGTELLKLIGKF